WSRRGRRRAPRRAHPPPRRAHDWACFAGFSRGARERPQECPITQIACLRRVAVTECRSHEALLTQPFRSELRGVSTRFSTDSVDVSTPPVVSTSGTRRRRLDTLCAR